MIYQRLLGASGLLASQRWDSKTLSDALVSTATSRAEFIQRRQMLYFRLRGSLIGPDSGLYEVTNRQDLIW